MTKLLFIVMVVGASVLPIILASGDPCNIHSSSNSNTTQATRLRGSLPVRALPGWLHVSDLEIKEWYERGKAECGAFLASNATSMKTNFPPPYQESRDIPFQGQSKCRGRDMLYSLTGIVVWPFGPMGGCATYSNCWFGLLTCGELNKQYLSSIATKPILDVLHIHRPGANLPTMGNWSISALRIHLRLLGLEIIVPDQRLVSVASGSNSGMDDVLIGQYVITIPDNNYKLEIRLTELYPSSLYPWSKEDIDVYGMEIPGNIYLGGSESRCNGGHCRWRNVCCGCDEKSFVIGTPIIIDAVSGIEKCPEVLKMRQAHERHSKRKRAHEGVSDSYLDTTQKEPASLPLCKAMDSKSPGRWILSSQTRLRTIAKHTVSCHSNRSVNAFSDVPLGSKGPKQESVTGKSAHRHSTGDWFEASGDPCIIKDGDPEDGGESSWFFAPYTCRYHFYTNLELHQCLKAKGISHIHFHGDSMSRDLYLYVARYLGVSTVSESELKRMTNVMKQNNIKTHSEGIIMSEGYTWDWSVEVMDIIKKVPYPQVVITNYGFVHNLDTFAKFGKKFEASEEKYWHEYLMKNRTGVTGNSLLPEIPKYLMYQSAKSLNGKRNLNTQWSTHNFRRSSDVLKSKYESLGFQELDEYTLTAGRVDNYGENMDGWHFWGSMRQMESVIFFNMICNDWFVASTP